MSFKTTKCCFVVEPSERVRLMGNGLANTIPEIKVFDSKFRVLDLNFVIYSGYLVNTIIKSKMLELDLCWL